MKYYMLEGSFTQNLPQPNALKTALDAHLAYLKTGFENGSILVSGPKVGAGGGVIVVKCEDIEAFCKNDPLVQAGVQRYRITEFTLYNAQQYVKQWFTP